MKDPLQLSQ